MPSQHGYIMIRQRLKSMRFKRITSSFLKNNFSQNGFTLLEVLIAIAILSILMVSIYSIMDNSVESKDRITKEDSELLYFETAIATMSKDIEAIYSPLYYESTKALDELLNTKAQRKAGILKNNSQDEDDQRDNPYEEDNQVLNDNFKEVSESGKLIPTLVNEEKGSFVFLATNGRRLFKDQKQSNLQWIRYRVVSDTSEDENEINPDAPYALTRTIINKNIFSDNLEWEKAKEYVILRNLKDFKFLFWESTKEKYVDALRLLGDIEKKAPKLIKAQISYISPSGDTIETERVFRPSWPKIDVNKNLEAKYDFSKKSGPSGGISGGNN